ncbi:hypothetical protein ACHAW6_011422, partial [Cyclotella cf. meneghiniana]
MHLHASRRARRIRRNLQELPSHHRGRRERRQVLLLPYYGFTEGNPDRIHDAGWMCAQHRVGRAFGWLHSQYAGAEPTIPDYLVIVDDDSFMDMVAVMRSLEEAEKERKEAEFALG